MPGYIEDLDAALIADGTDIILRRTVAGVDRDLQIRANVRKNLGNSSEAFPAGRGADVIDVIMSPTPIIAANWPSVPAGESIPVWHPKRGDILVIDARKFEIQACDQIKIGTDVVRFNIVARGGVGGV